jgi:hypothetical protein
LLSHTHLPVLGIYIMLYLYKEREKKG